MSTAEIEALAVSLYESDCRERAGGMARRTTLSRVRAYYSFPAWAHLGMRERWPYRVRAYDLVKEHQDHLADEAEWEAAAR